MMWFGRVLSVVMLMALSACSVFMHKNAKIPHAPQVTRPGGMGSQWRYIGISNDGLLVDEINTNSITGDDVGIYRFQDRKTIVTKAKFNYPDNQPHFKYILSDWHLNCNNSTYKLDDVSLFDQNSTLIKQDTYNNSKWLQFGSGSFASLQYQFICKNKNRNLGY